ncbi:hypothetical protein FDJ70_06440 [Clostridium botulinum]|nr:MULTISPECIES: hypothetical protein [Clostridium]AYF53421.1 hypothetical protein DFH04_01025 [Clostridium novyi]MCD3217530.1 hypothetical protein [Clostridium botulinum C]NFV47310.1 hypothetical protein [Clostridium botulinum]QPW55869.1 hypothetical protein IRP61_02310 [Clostridium botulinum]
MNNKNNKYVAVLSSAALGTLIATTVATTALAKTTGILVKDNTGKNFEYDIEQLKNSAIDKSLGDTALLFDDYQSKELVAFHDNVKGYINGQDVLNASVQAAMEGEQFDLDNFTEKEAPENTILDVKDVAKVSEKDEKIIVDSKKEPVKETIKVESVGAIDETTVKVTFDSKIDKVSKENFKISGVEVTGVLQDEEEKAVIISIDNYMPHDAKISFNGIKVNGEDVQLTDKYIDNSTRSSIELKANKEQVMVYSDKANEPVEITVNVNKLPKNSEATLEFSTTFGQIVKQETTTNGEVKVKLAPEIADGDREAVVTAKILTVKDTKTGTVYPVYKNVDLGSTKVKFKMNHKQTESGKVFRITGALTDQADRVYVKLNEPLNESVLEKLQKKTDSIKVYNGGDTKKPIAVEKVVRKDAKTLILVLDTKDANFPLIDNVKHSVKFEYQDDELVVNGESKFFLEDSNYIKMIQVKTSQDDKTLQQNQIRVIFNEAVNNVSEGKEGFNYSVQNKSNWVIDGLNLKNNLPSKDEKNVDIKVESIDKNAETRDSVILTFKNPKDVKEFIADEDSEGKLVKHHKLEVNNVGDWASITDKHNIVATQELEYSSVKLKKPEVKLQCDSPEQFIVKFTEKVDLGDEKDLSKRFTVVVPNKTNNSKDPYAVGVRKFALTGDKIHVTPVGEDAYVIELTEDWTKIFNTDKTKENYHDELFNEIKVEINGAKDIIGNAIETGTGTGICLTNGVKLTEDVVSPKIVKAEQTTKTGNVKITMNEPVQFVDRLGNHMDSQVTPSEQQEFKADTEKEKGKVPTATFEYVQVKDAEGNKVTDIRTIPGVIESLNDYDLGGDSTRDFVATIKPQTELAFGEWKLVVRSISDDVGNTMTTKTIGVDEIGGKASELIKVVKEEHKEEVKETKEIPLELEGIDAHHDVSIYHGKDDCDIIHIKFNKNMSLVGSNSVLEKNNYRLDGRAIPVEGTRIERGLMGIKGHETDKDSVTIILPNGYLQENDDKHILTIMNVNGANTTEKVNAKEVIPFKHIHENGGIVNPTKADKKVLNDKIQEFSKLNEKDYTAETWKAFAEALKNAQTIAGKEDATEDEVKAQVKAIEDAKGKLAKDDAKKEEVKKEEVPFAVTIKSSPSPGKIIVVVKLDGVQDASKYNVKVDGQDAKFIAKAGNFVITIQDKYNRDEKLVKEAVAISEIK